MLVETGNAAPVDRRAVTTLIQNSLPEMTLGSACDGMRSRLSFLQFVVCGAAVRSTQAFSKSAVELLRRPIAEAASCPHRDQSPERLEKSACPSG